MPYQVVIDRPNSSVNVITRIDDYSNLAEFIPRSGRALAVPAYWGTLERREALPDFRERVVRQVQDFRRTIGYLETRDDIDSGRLAYTGMSAGGEHKRLVTISGGRVTADRHAQIRETLAWLDRYLGSVPH